MAIYRHKNNCPFTKTVVNLFLPTDSHHTRGVFSVLVRGYLYLPCWTVWGVWNSPQWKGGPGGPLPENFEEYIIL